MAPALAPALIGQEAAVCALLGLVLGSALDRKRTIAADILFEALLGSNEAPVKKAILAAGLGGNVVSYTAAESLQPYELIMLQNAQPGVARELRRVFQDACANTAFRASAWKPSSAATNTTCVSATTASPTAWPLRATR